MNVFHYLFDFSMSEVLNHNFLNCIDFKPRGSDILHGRRAAKFRRIIKIL